MDEWARARRLRLEMLRDAPQSFDITLAEAQSWDDERWRVRLASALMHDSALLVAVDEGGSWLGQMAAREYLDHDPARVWLLEVYVTPALRSTGLAAELLAGIEAWALARGYSQLHLDVHEGSIPARRFYQRMGFAETGSTQPYPLDRSHLEVEMVKTLA